jgi:hypothetical protein
VPSQASKALALPPSSKSFPRASYRRLHVVGVVCVTAAIAVGSGVVDVVVVGVVGVDVCYEGNAKIRL